MSGPPTLVWRRIAVAVALITCLATPSSAAARQPTRPLPNTTAAPSKSAPPAATGPVATETTDPIEPVAPPESIEVDVSTHTVAVTSGFVGSEIVVFGTVVHSRQPSADSGYYDVVVLAEGRTAPTVVRRKEQVGGLYINAEAVRFDNLPLYSAIASTRPIEELADPAILVAQGIGLPRARMVPGRGSSGMTAETIDDTKSAFLRLKQREHLYVRDDFGVAFIGRALFRASLKLPANIPVGPLIARVFLFHDGKLLSIHTASVVLRRTGFEALAYDFAFRHPFWYGSAAVAFAAAAGLAASAVARRWS